MNTNDKINQDFLKQYSSVFSDKLLKPAYENKQHLTGKDILNLSSIKQLNLFVIKAFFNEWQEEVKKLESPLFDYKSREVRKSMIDFMNTLSQHISIEQKHLKPYVEQALQSTILLASNVGEFLQNEFADKKSTRVSSKFIKSQLKYTVLHKDLLLEFFTSVEGETVREALNKSVLFFEDLDATDTEDELIASLSQYLVLDKGDLFIPSFQLDEPEVSVDSEMEENPVDENFDQRDHEPEELPASSSDYFGSLSNVETPAEQPEEEPDFPDHEAERNEVEEFEDTSEEEELIEETKESDLQIEAEQSLEEGSEVMEEPSSFDNDEVAEAEEEDEAEDSEQNADASPTDNTLAEKFEVDQKTLAELHEEQKIDSVFEAISINHRYMFLQELFDGDNELFTTALKDVDACGTFDEAVEMLVQNYAKDFFWDMNSDEVKELLKVVYRKFRS